MKKPAAPPAEVKKGRAQKSAAVGKAAKIKADKPKTPAERLDEIGIEAICAEIVNGESLRSFCANNGVNMHTTIDWIEKDPDRSLHYARAREERADTVFDSLDDVSDQAVRAGTAIEVAGLRLKADNIKWKLARMNAKKYGEKLSVDADLTVNSLTDEQLLAKATALGAKVGLLPKK